MGDLCVQFFKLARRAGHFKSKFLKRALLALFRVLSDHEHSRKWKPKRHS
jgi:hypothetical protein